MDVPKSIKTLALIELRYDCGEMKIKEIFLICVILCVVVASISSYVVSSDEIHKFLHQFLEGTLYVVVVFCKNLRFISISIFLILFFLSMRKFSIIKFCLAITPIILEFLFIAICNPLMLLVSLYTKSYLEGNNYNLSIFLSFVIAPAVMYFLVLYIQFSLLSYIRNIEIDKFFELKIGDLENNIAKLGACNLAILFYLRDIPSTEIVLFYIVPSLLVISPVSLILISKFFKDTSVLLKTGEQTSKTSPANHQL